MCAQACSLAAGSCCGGVRTLLCSSLAMDRAPCLPESSSSWPNARYAVRLGCQLRCSCISAGAGRSPWAVRGLLAGWQTCANAGRDLRLGFLQADKAPTRAGKPLGPGRCCSAGGLRAQAPACPAGEGRVAAGDPPLPQQVVHRLQHGQHGDLHVQRPPAPHIPAPSCASAGSGLRALTLPGAWRAALLCRARPAPVSQQAASSALWGLPGQCCRAPGTRIRQLCSCYSGRTQPCHQGARCSPAAHPSATSPEKGPCCHAASASGPPAGTTSVCDMKTTGCRAGEEPGHSSSRENSFTCGRRSLP